MAAPISDEIAQKIFKALEEQYVPVLKLFKYMPLVWNSIILKSSFNKKKTRFVEIRVMPDQTWKKKICMELEFMELEFHIKHRYGTIKM